MYCMYSKGYIGKIQRVVSLVITNILQPLEHKKKNILVNYSNCFLRIIIYCMYSKGDTGKISHAVNHYE